MASALDDSSSGTCGLSGARGPVSRFPRTEGSAAPLVINALVEARFASWELEASVFSRKQSLIASVHLRECREHVDSCAAHGAASRPDMHRGRGFGSVVRASCPYLISQASGRVDGATDDERIVARPRRATQNCRRFMGSRWPTSMCQRRRWFSRRLTICHARVTSRPTHTSFGSCDDRSPLETRDCRTHP